MKKSHETAGILAFLFGPIGCLYTSIGYTIRYILLYILALMLAGIAFALVERFVIDPTISQWLKIPLALVIPAMWIYLSFGARKQVMQQNQEQLEKEAIEERRHQETLQAIRESGVTTHMTRHKSDKVAD